MTDWISNILCSTLAGICASLVSQPLDTIKCREQTFPNQYRSIIQTSFKIIKEERIRGLFKGFLPSLLNIIPNTAISFSFYYHAEKYLSELWKHKHRGLIYFTCGCYAGFFTLFFSVPFDNIKCVQQFHREKVLSFKETAQIIYRKFGILGFTRGYAVTFNRDFWGFGFYFLPYNLLKDFGDSKGIKSTLYYIVIGGFAGAFSWIPTYPTDIVKTRIQSNIYLKVEAQWKMLKLILLNEGFKGLYTGLTTTLIRSFLVNSIVFFGNDYFHSIFDDLIKNPIKL